MKFLRWQKNLLVVFLCMMPYITSFFMPRTAEDRPKVAPDKAVNF
ncbi:oleate hydratase, partial [Paraclostridium sordellii]